MPATTRTAYDAVPHTDSGHYSMASPAIGDHSSQSDLAYSLAPDSHHYASVNKVNPHTQGGADAVYDAVGADDADNAMGHYAMGASES